MYSVHNWKQFSRCCSSGDSLHYLVNEMEKKSRLLKEKTGEVLRYIKVSISGPYLTGGSCVAIADTM